MIISTSQAQAIRRKQSDKQLLNKEVAYQIGISPMTWRKIRVGNYNAKNTVYAKVMEWLAKDY